MEKRRRSRARRVVRAAGRAGMAGLKGAIIQAATGAVANLGQTAVATRIPFVAQNWWTGPAGLAVLGILMKRRPRFRGLGDAMLGAAGYAGALGYTYAKAAAVTAGETSALYEPDVGMLVGGQLKQLGAAGDMTSSHYVAPESVAGDVSAAYAL